MKREFLQNLNTEGSPLSKEVIDAIMAENGRDIQKAKAGFSDYEQVKQELEQVRQELERLQGLDFEALQQSAADWQQKYDQAVTQHAQQMQKLRFDHALNQAISQMGGRSEKAIAAMLDLDVLRNSEDQPQAIMEALKALKEESAYLFQQELMSPVYARGTGSRTGEIDEVPATLAGALKEKYERK